MGQDRDREAVWARSALSTGTEPLRIRSARGTSSLKYYEEAVVVRDMFQNHLMQLITLTAMEPPSSLDADAVRDEKVKVLRAIRPVLSDGSPAAVRGQYGTGQ